jgi:hypothetical protein
VEWQASAIGNGNNMGDQDDLPFDVCKEVQQRILDQLDMVIEEIIKLMLEVEKKATNSREKWNRGGPVEVGKQKQQKQGRGEDGQLQREVWDLGGFQQLSRGAHEQDLMIFPVVEYDAGASFHLIMHQHSVTSTCIQ